MGKTRDRWRRFGLVGTVVVFWLALPTLGLTVDLSLLVADGGGRLERRTFSLRSNREATELGQFLDRLIQVEAERAEAWQQRRESLLQAKAWNEMSPTELMLMHHAPVDGANKKASRGWRELRRLTDLWLQAPDAERGQLEWTMAEIAQGANNTFRPPIPANMELIIAPYLHWDYLTSPMICGTIAATNIDESQLHEDNGRLDPPPSTFWQSVPVEDQDLFAGFGRADLPQVADEPASYDEPKVGYGLNPGLEVRWDDQRVKVKFGEIRSEPFVARVFAALGYNVDPTDYSPGLRLRYDRRFFREFNLRRPVVTKICFAGLPLRTVRFQPRHSPLDYVARAVLKDGRAISRDELRRILFFDPTGEHPELDPNNFRSEIEDQIALLLTTPANLQLKSSAHTSIGPWNFDRLGHENLREVRGAGLLAAWLGCFEVRVENTRLKLVPGEDGTAEVRHYFSDVGSALGRAVGLTTRTADDPNSFTWTFTGPGQPAARRQSVSSLRITDFLLVEDNEAFMRMTVNDARWMARRIARLSENQIVAGLIAAGYDSAAVRLLLEKLASRRDQMLRDLGLSDEIPLFRPEGVNRFFSYDPAVNGPMSAQRKDGSTVVAPISQWRIVKGVLRARD